MIRVYLRAENMEERVQVAMFDSANEALEFAMALVNQYRRHNIEVRADVESEITMMTFDYPKWRPVK